MCFIVLLLSPCCSGYYDIKQEFVLPSKVIFPPFLTKERHRFLLSGYSNTTKENMFHIFTFKLKQIKVSKISNVTELKGAVSWEIS